MAVFLLRSVFSNGLCNISLLRTHYFPTGLCEMCSNNYCFMTKDDQHVFIVGHYGIEPELQVVVLEKIVFRK